MKFSLYISILLISHNNFSIFRIYLLKKSIFVLEIPIVLVLSLSELLFDKKISDLMQQIAFENNLSETAFINISKTPFEIRWFTPTVEVDLCGHATLASAKTLFEYYPQVAGEVIRFTCLEHGILIAKKADDEIFLDFPADIATPANLSEEISKAIKA